MRVYLSLTSPCSLIMLTFKNSSQLCWLQVLTQLYRKLPEKTLTSDGHDNDADDVCGVACGMIFHYC